MSARSAARKSEPELELSDLERQIVELLCDGKTNAEVAEALGFSPRTVETYRLRLLKKLGITHMPALVKYAIKHGLTPLEL